jgi:hypothetical protein
VIAAAILLAAAASGPGVGSSSPGDLALCPSGPAVPGRSYDLGKARFADTGSDGETLHISFTPAAAGTWLTPSAADISLAPGQGTYVDVILRVPASAVNGEYGAKIQASAGGTGAQPPPGGAAVTTGAAAAVPIAFEVGNYPQPVACTVPAYERASAQASSSHAPSGPPTSSAQAGKTAASAPRYAQASPAASQGSGVSGKSAALWALGAVVVLAALAARRIRGRR